MLFVLHRVEATLASLMELSRLRLMESDDQRMVVEMLPPTKAVSTAPFQDASYVHPPLSTSLSELSQPLRVTITFADADKTSVSNIQVCALCMHMFYYFCLI